MIRGVFYVDIILQGYFLTFADIKQPAAASAVITIISAIFDKKTVNIL